MDKRNEIESMRAVTAADAKHLRERGWAVLRNVFSPDTISSHRPILRDYVLGSQQAMSPAERAMGASATKTIFSLRDAPQPVADFVTSPRLGEIATRLLGVEAVRVLHFCGFFKPGGGPPTPWHQDLNFIPLDTDRVLSAWIPLTDVTPDMGALVFAEGSHRDGPLDPMAASQFPFARHGALRAGDVSLHMGWTLHASLKNTTARMREAIAVSYYADGARIQVRGDVPFLQSLLSSYFPGLAPGELAAGPMNPVVFRQSDV